jgi:hypothetical protein
MPESSVKGMDFGQKIKQHNEQGLKQIGILIELTDKHGQTRGEFRVFDSRRNDRHCFVFGADDDPPIEAGGQVRVKAAGDLYTIVQSKAEVIGDTVVSRIAYVDDEVSNAQLQINISNSRVGQLNTAGGDMQVVNRTLFGDHAEEVQSILEQMRLLANGDDSLSTEEKQDAITDIDNLQYELQKQQPRAERVLAYMGHFASIATLVQLANSLGQYLAIHGI